MANIMILGKNGQVGFSLQKIFLPETQCHAFNSQEADLTDEKKLRGLIREIRPEVIVNAAAYNRVDMAEHHEAEAFKVNARGPQVLGEEASALGASVIHFSTDYVFDGKKEAPYAETDKASPLNTYGASKLEGEKLLMAACPQTVILRTSWVVSDHGQNFLKTILKLAQERDELRIVMDQVGAPTPANLLAGITNMLVTKLIAEGWRGFPFGIYHVASSGQTNWYECAKFIVEKAIKLGIALRVDPSKVHPIKTLEYPTPARRPLNSRLDTSLFRGVFPTPLPPWEEGLFDIIKAVHDKATP
jgi:dTDP-4-dehydrorhamnose reductase